MTRTSVILPDGKNLPLVEEFFSIQGEGFHAGKAAWFIRLGGCDVGCNWCDTRFAWDPDIHPVTGIDIIIGNAVNSGADSVVVTGGEPLMWNLDHLCAGLIENEIQTFLETSGAWMLTGKWDWICLSPKRNMPPGEEICSMAHELKIIIENRDDFIWAERNRMLVSNSCHLFLQPEWSRFDSIIPDIIDYVRKNPEWRISLQIHKYMHIP
ncbi:MAG TPA: 7-carboxy-7-deazaguanine synthase QueE [Bacteroidales bacterium]|nr:7-carboxy-7-deazaguanine synthase QueE [Bacteroidales bacterium]